MAPPLRLALPRAVSHVTSRSNTRAAIHADDTDRTTFLALLAQVVQRAPWLCHAYCLLEHHDPPVPGTPEGRLARGMRQVNGLSTQWYNRHHSPVDHVLQGRYKAFLLCAKALERCQIGLQSYQGRTSPRRHHAAIGLRQGAVSAHIAAMS